MKTHRLKIHPNYLDRLLDGTKTCELRYNDRDYQTGDILEFESLGYIPNIPENCRFEITHVLENYNGLAPQYAILSLKRL